MIDDPRFSSLADRPLPARRPVSQRERDRHVVAGFWLAVQRLLRRRTEPAGPSTADWYPPGHDSDDGASGARVPLRPSGSSGSAAAAAEPSDDDSRSRDID